MKILAIIIMGIALVGCEASNVLLHTNVIEDIVENCPNEVTEIVIGETEYEVTATVDRECLDTKIDEHNNSQ